VEGPTHKKGKGKNGQTATLGDEKGYSSKQERGLGGFPFERERVRSPWGGGRVWEDLPGQGEARWHRKNPRGTTELTKINGTGFTGGGAIPRKDTKRVDDFEGGDMGE